MPRSQKEGTARGKRKDGGRGKTHLRPDTSNRLPPPSGIYPFWHGTIGMLPRAVRDVTKAFRLATLCPRLSTNLPSLILSPVASSSTDGYGDPRTTPTRRRLSHSAKWRPVRVLDEWVAKEARPISLRQLMVFGRSLTEARLISSANYVRTELPTRIAHRIRDMQRLPYVVVTNPHISDVYELYYNAFDTFRRIKEVKTLEDNERLCKEIFRMLRAHLTVIPKLSMGILECSGLMPAAELDHFMNTILRSRISRRVIAEQHLALTETFNSHWFSPGAKLSESEFIGEVFIRCVAKDVIEHCAKAVQGLARSANGPNTKVPEIRINGHLDASFPYILSHLEYIIGELLRNSVQAVIEKYQEGTALPAPIEVTVCEAQQHVIIRISDQGGGIPRDILPYLWSFGKGPLKNQHLANLEQVPLMAATLQELRADDGRHHSENASSSSSSKDPSDPKVESATLPYSGGGSGHESSLSSLSTRPPNLRLGMGLPLSRVYAEYWAGSLELHSLEGYGVDAFLQISKLGNKNEQLTTRAAMDAV
ncbi:alpha-ketoacid dehydrogenase kinase [Durotheca rogersii]|uniref:alpha-ketoacid dehydrogenase kinase n=1 Tax=Durotheca rogersii TaxID=419775 RepID=UPI00221F98E4|nr:alpha-ketoacid dehydrogenase kinase [Durotheca rogersii]KAI5867168.1 alpha-ketoacid dehydrogenase kinase [Durotheca rogersii]